MSRNTHSARFIAWQSLNQVIIDKKPLSQFWDGALNQLSDSRDRAFCHELVLGSLRHYQSLRATLNQFLKKPIANKNKSLEILLVSAFYQLKFLHHADYAVINETVNLCQLNHLIWAKGLTNATLRNYIKAEKPYINSVNLPDWLFNKLKITYPNNIDNLLTELQTAPAIMLRIHQGERQQHLNDLQMLGIDCEAHPDAKEAIIIKGGSDIFSLPQFQSGQLTVQDANAQLAANLLQIKAGQNILDACAAPGGKTAHIYAKSKPLTPFPQITALDNNPKRITKMQQTLNRLQCDINIETMDLIEFSQTTDKQFDRILLDVPCSATGVMAKHPDIVFIRDKETVDELLNIQSKLLDAAWRILKPDGILLYATCSILPEENQQQIKQFLAKHAHAQLDKLAHNRAITSDQGNNKGTLQFLPNKLGDGFFYARIKKASA